jgi:hypothetical protein
MITPPVIVQPDLEGFVYEQIAGMPGVTAFCFAATQQDAPGWVYAYSIQVDARAGRKKAARDLAEQCRQIIIGLPGVPWPDGVVCYVHATDGPFWLADPDGGPRYCARYEIRAHPRNATAAPPNRAAPADPAAIPAPAHPSPV